MRPRQAWAAQEAGRLAGVGGRDAAGHRGGRSAGCVTAPSAACAACVGWVVARWRYRLVPEGVAADLAVDVDVDGLAEADEVALVLLTAVPLAGSLAC